MGKVLNGVTFCMTSSPPLSLGLQVCKLTSTALVMQCQAPETCADAAESGLELLDDVQLGGSDAALPSFSL